MAENPRIDELRKRLEKDPGSRLFAQLAEELRKDGEFEEAIRVSREGLARHPNYPSARMTLGRALYESGDLSAARAQFESVLKAAPDNILASRLLAECLEGLGDMEGALARYRLTVQLSPGDRAVQARVDDLEKRLRVGSAALAPPPTPAAPEAPLPASPPVAPPPPPAVAAPAPPSEEAAPAAIPPPPSAPEPAPIPLASVEDADFELEAAYEAPAAQWQPPRAEEPAAEQPAPETPSEPSVPAAEGRAERAGEPAPVPAGEAGFELEAVYETARPQWTAPAPGPPEIVSPSAPQPGPQPPKAPPPAPTEPSPAAAEPDLTSPTLAELYFKQGLTDRAIEVYRRLLEREPGNERARARLAELSAPTPGPPEPELEPAAAAVGDPREARRQDLQRTIDRLERFLNAIRREPS